MNLKALSEIVHCQNCGEALLKANDETAELKCENCKQSYPVKSGVPVFLSETDYEKSAETAIHKEQGSVFNYVDHYQKDGVESDYFRARDAGTEHLDKRIHQTIFSHIEKKSG